MSDSKGAAIDGIRKVLFACSRGMATRPKDYDIILDEKGVNEAIDAILALLAQEVKRVRLEWFKAGQEDIINHYHHDPEIRRAVKAATLKARKAGLV